jgi:hypothetical protein
MNIGWWGLSRTAESRAKPLFLTAGGIEIMNGRGSS